LPQFTRKSPAARALGVLQQEPFTHALAYLLRLFDLIVGLFGVCAAARALGVLQ